MSIEAMRQFRTDALNMRASEPGDVVYAGATVAELRKNADNAAAQAVAKSDLVAAALWVARSTALGKVQYVAPGAVGIRWRESQDRLYFIVPNVGIVQSITPREFVRYWSPESGDALYAAMERGISEVYRIVEGWGWTLTG